MWWRSWKSCLRGVEVGPVLLAILVLSTGCSDWRDKVKPGLAVAEPTQTEVEALPTELTFGETKATLTARARYSTKAWVVAVDDDFDDPGKEIMTLDVSLAWGPMGNPDILREMKFHLARRYVSVRWSGDMPLDQGAVMGHLANTHLIFSDPALGEYLSHVREGDLLELGGYLVDVQVGPHHIRTSLSRKDIGNGSCEVLWVDRAVITR